MIISINLSVMYPSHPSFKKHHFVKDRNYYRKSQLVKIQRTTDHRVSIANTPKDRYKI